MGSLTGVNFLHVCKGAQPGKIKPTGTWLLSAAAARQGAAAKKGTDCNAIQRPTSSDMENTHRAKTVHPWLTKQKSHEIFRSTASTVDIPMGWDPRAKQQQRVAFADFSAAPWQGFEKSERCPNNSSLFLPQAAVVVVALWLCLRRCAPPPCSSPFHRADKKKNQNTNVFWFFLVRWKGLEPPAY